MDAPLTDAKLTEERAFMKRYTEGLSSHKVEYASDFSTPLEDRPRKVPAVQVSYQLFRLRGMIDLLYGHVSCGDGDPGGNLPEGAARRQGDVSWSRARSRTPGPILPLRDAA